VTTTTLPQLRDEPGIRFGIAHAVLIAVLLVAGLLGLGSTATEVLVVLVMGLVSAGLPWPLRPVIGVIAWAFVTGFVVNAAGQLTFDGADDRRLVVFVAAIVAVASGCRLVPRAPGSR